MGACMIFRNDAPVWPEPHVPNESEQAILKRYRVRPIGDGSDIRPYFSVNRFLESRFDLIMKRDSLVVERNGAPVGVIRPVFPCEDTKVYPLTARMDQVGSVLCGMAGEGLKDVTRSILSLHRMIGDRDVA
jgi:hypothetical protein